MEVTLLLDIDSRDELYRWFVENHGTVGDFWLRVNRAAEDCPGVIRYVDAVEVALCFGWIDSTMKRIDDGKAVQHFTPRRKGCNWCEHNVERCRRLIRRGEMTPAGLAVIPDLDPAHFVFEDWVLAAIRADRKAWKFFRSLPENYRRIKIDRIQHYNHTGRTDYAEKTLQKFISDCHDGRIQPGWSDFGRLENY